MERLNKYIAMSGYCSRRKADELIKSGKVKINNEIVTDLSHKVNEEIESVTVEDQIIQATTNFKYIMFHKPKGCVTTCHDEKGRMTVFDYLTDLNIPRLFPVGRLDYDTEGLLILTNDGDLANRITHPSKDIPKVYRVTINGSINEDEIRKLRNGVILDGSMTKKTFVTVLKRNKSDTKIEIAITEGRNRQIRRMFESIDKEVTFLKRVAIGQIYLGGLTRGKYRQLSREEIEYLKCL